MMRKVIGIIMAAGLGLALWLSGGAAADDISDARVILKAKANTIKKWQYPPRVVVVHEHPVDEGAFADVMDFITAATGLALEPPTFVEMTGLDTRFYTASRYGPRTTGPGRMTSDLLIAQQEDLSLTANIFVFMVSPPVASHFIALTLYGRSSANLPRAYVQGSGPCYFNVLSNGESIHFGTILIAPDIDPAMQRSCIYEEMVQSMGLMNDAHDSTFFTFDNLNEDKPRDYDRRLLSALYDDQITNGDDVEKVLNVYANIQ